MSSLKDIMDVDVEPLQSQAYRRAEEAAKQQASGTSVDQSSATPSPLHDDSKGKAPIKRRRSNRVSKLSNHPTVSRPSPIRRRSSAAGEAMDFTSGFHAESSTQASASGSPQQSSSRGSEPAPDVPVKYTPVTGRISRAKKGVPVHTCDTCRPVKTFTRAEHLRRHQLSHQKPAYPCTFRDCERAFHRPDLLARHLHRHETQGEKPYKSPGSRSRASSSPTEDRTPPLKVETPSQGAEIASANQTSPTDSITPRTSASVDSSMTAFSGIPSSFQTTDFPQGASHTGSVDNARLPGTDSYQSVSPGPGSSNYGTSNFPTGRGSDLSNQDSFSRQLGFNDMYSEGSNTNFPNYTTPHALPLLRIPEETYIPGLSYTQENSPWCSSASDSTYSTQSDGSRTGRQWNHRARSASVHTVPDWSANATQFSPHNIIGTPQDLRNGQFDAILEQYETPYTSPRMTPSSLSRHLLDVPNSNSFGGYYMESVGTPALSTYNKPLAQIFSASSSRISDSRLGGIDIKRKEFVEPQLGTLSINAAMTHLAHLDPYMSSYWHSFDQHFPIIHHGTFDPAENNLLTFAMAAIGTQYHNTIEARQKGIELNDYCRKNIDHCLNWDLHTMQAILLTELFTRFRSRKTIVKTSRQFEELYNRLLNTSNQGQLSFSAHSPSNAASADALLDRFSPLSTSSQHLQRRDIQSEWVQWIDTEARQRLLASCFMLDIHQSLYHEQNRSNVHLAECSSMLCLPCPENIWNTTSASEWQINQSGYSAQPLHQIEHNPSSQLVGGTTSFSQSLLICSFASRLPARVDPKYPNDFFPENVHPTVINLRTLFPTSPLAHIYLALHHTPLHDLLAIAGDTWVFGKKITPPSAFHSAQSRLKVWSSSLNAAAATQHACHILSLILSQPYSSDQTQSYSAFSISDYWAVYISALICWAFGNRYQSPSSGTISRSNSSNAIHNSGMEVDSPQTPVDARVRALSYIQGILELGTEDLLTSKAHMKGETAGVVDAVRVRLEIDSVGSKCMMLVDAVHVLTRIKESGRGKWF